MNDETKDFYEDDLFKIDKKFGIFTYTGEWKWDVRSNGNRIKKFKFLCECGEEVWKGKSSIDYKNVGEKGCGCNRLRRCSIGNRFGSLIIIDKDGKNSNREVLWICRCDCGEEITVLGKHLLNGRTISCGCVKREKVKNETGKKYGKLTVITYKGLDEHNAARWLCRCDCGEEKIIVGSHLRSGRNKSCGCIRRENTTYRKQSYINYHIEG